MPTDNPKISLYVPQSIYDRFTEFTNQQGLSMSQAGIVILAEYFGLEEIIKETTKGTTVGGVTLDRVQSIEEKLKELEIKYNQLQVSVSQLKQPEVKIEESIVETQPEGLQLKPPSVLLFSASFLSQRFKLKNARSVTNASNKSNFAQWSRDKDPDNIAWQKVKDNSGFKFTPVDDTPSELLSKL